jgi:hypothetical protein
MYVECSQSQGHTCPPPSPLAPPPPPAAGLRFISSPFQPPPPLDYGQILAASPEVEDGLRFGDCEYDR